MSRRRTSAASATTAPSPASRAKRLTAAQAQAIRDEMADSGCSRAEARAWVLEMGAAK